MKITRLRKGYRINLSDSEFAALSRLVSVGNRGVMLDPAIVLSNLHGGVRYHLTAGRLGRFDAMAVDEDRRPKTQRTAGDDLPADFNDHRAKGQVRTGDE